MTQQVHDEFAFVGVGQTQLITAIREPAPALLRMPAFVTDPARGMGAESQVGGVFFAAGEDAVAGAELGVEFCIGDFGSLTIKGAGGFEGVKRKTA